MRFLSLTLLLCFFLTFTIQAQALPTIDFFTVDNHALDYAAVERGYETANFSWQAGGLRAGDKMEMHAWVNNDWRLIGEGFEAAKTDSLVIAHPLSFELPRYRLSVVDSSGQRIVESVLELQYAESSVAPRIAYFLSRELSFTPQSIQNQEGVAVHWWVYNRWYRSNIVYEQVMPDGRVISIAENVLTEFRRAVDQGVLYPRYPGDGEDVVLRLRVVDIDTGETLAQLDTILPIIASNTPPPELLSFSVSPSLGTRGGTATLSWNVANANRVYITQTATGVSGCKFTLPPDEVYEDLPTTGTLDVQIPAEAYGAIRFQLVPDRYLVEAYSCEPSGILEEIYLELESYNAHNPLIREISLNPGSVALAGNVLELHWDISEGQSVLIQQGSGYGENALQQTFSDLPLMGSLQITIPNTPQVRQDSYIWISLYLVREGVAEPEYLWSDSLSIDRDDNLNCEAFIRTEPPMITPIPPSQEIAVTWNGCGAGNLVLRTILEETTNYSIIQDSSQDVADSGSFVTTAPNQEGVVRFILYRVLEGQQIELQRASLLIEN
jgi:hypothetical protein